MDVDAEPVIVVVAKGSPTTCQLAEGVGTGGIVCQAESKMGAASVAYVPEP